jgi:hypothetical protein
MKKPLKAYKNLDFLNSPDAREIRILAEYLEPKHRFEKYKIRDTIVFFGSSRLISKEDAKDKIDQFTKNYKQKENINQDPVYKKLQKLLDLSKYYEAARELSRRLTLWSAEQKEELQFTICTGGGPGIMEAANRGAMEAGGESVGLGISLPNLQELPNPYISGHLNFEFHYFFMRKFWFIYLAKALIVFPGGFGTLDELFETLTLIQTRKMTKKIPVIIFGKSFWEQLIHFDMLKENYLINPDDDKLFFLTDSIDDAFEMITSQLINQFVNRR